MFARLSGGRLQSGRRIGLVLATVALLPFQLATLGSDIFWNGSLSSNWQVGANWDGGVVPIDGDTATLNVPAADTVALFDNVFGIDGLTVSNGIELSTNGYFLNVDEVGTAVTSIVGADTTLVVTPRVSNPAQPAFKTEVLDLGGQAQIVVGGALTQADVLTTTVGTSVITGYGTMEFGNDFSPATPVLVHDGTIRVTRPLLGAQPLTLRALGSGTLDLDGTGGGLFDFETGVLDVDDGNQFLSGALSLVIDGPLADSFNGEIMVGQSDTIDFRDPWSLGAQGPESGLLSLNGSNGTATLTGSQATIVSTGRVHVASGTGAIDAPLLVDGGELEINAAATGRIQEDITIESTSTITNNGTLVFDGVDRNLLATINGGTWTGNGTIKFGGSSPFISMTNVLGTTTIDMAVVDLDGDATSTHTLAINATKLTLQVDSIDNGDGNGSPANQFDDIMNIDQGTLEVTFNNPSDTWVMNGLLQLDGVTNGGYSLNLRGAPVELRGATQVNSGRAGADAPLDITGTLTIAGGAEFGLISGGMPVTHQINGGTVDGAGMLSLFISQVLTGYGTIDADVDVRFGALTADNGTLSINGAVNLGGTIGTADSDAVLTVANAWSTGTGALMLQGGRVKGASITNSSLTSGYGDIALAGTFINDNTLSATGGLQPLVFNGPGGLDLDGSSGTGIVNAVDGSIHVQQPLGTTSFGGVLTIGVARELRIDTGGLLLEGAMHMNGGSYVATSFTNHGTLNVASDFSSTISASSQFDPTSITNINVGLGGGLNLDGPTRVFAGATFTGTGKLIINNTSTATFDNMANVGVEVVNQGDMQLGASPGLVTLAHFNNDTTGNLHIELGGTTAGLEHDSLFVSGDATLAGSLDVSLINSFMPAPGQSFEIIGVGGALVGTFTGLPQNALVASFDSTYLFINYAGGDGNDVTLYALGLPGDFNGDGVVDLADYTIWRDHLGAADDSVIAHSGDGVPGVDLGDYEVWRANFGNAAPANVSPTTVPEPATLWLLAAGWMAMRYRARR